MPRKGTKLSPEAQARQKASTEAWHRENTEVLKFSIRVRSGCSGAYKQLAAARGTSLTRIIKDYLDEQCRLEGIDV